MTPDQFTIWLKGFVTACNPHLPTPAQWDELVDTLNKVNTDSKKSSIFDKDIKGVYNIGTVNVPKEHWKTENSKQLLND